MQATATAPANRSGDSTDRPKGSFRHPKDYWTMLKETVSDWLEDKAMRLAAAMAFYTMLAIGPLLIIVIKIVSVIFRKDVQRGKAQNYVHDFIGGKAADVLDPIFKAAVEPGKGVMATIISIAVLLFSASGLFGELQDSLNTIWEVQPRPDRGIMGTIKDRFFSIMLVLGTAFLLMVSLVMTTAVAVIVKWVGGGGWFWEAVNFVLSIGIITVLFALMFKYLPDAKIRWRDVRVGAALTGVLFTVGKFALGWYLGKASTTSVYGAAGSLVALLLWVYYSAQILFFGAEFTQVFAQRRGEPIVPSKNAVKVTADERRSRASSPRKGCTPPPASARRGKARPR